MERPKECCNRLLKFREFKMVDLKTNKEYTEIFAKCRSCHKIHKEGEKNVTSS